MPHYKDGTEVQIGDIAKGTGYNVKGPDKEPIEIVGTVVGITPGSSSCNVQIAHVIAKQLPADFKHPDHRLYHRICVMGNGPNGGSGPQVAATLDLEYSQCDYFELVHRPGAVPATA